MLKLTHDGQEHIIPIGGRVRLSDGRILMNVQLGAEIADVTIEAYEPPEPAPQEPGIPDSVSARQFKLQLLAAGLLDQVEGWVSQQSQAVQIAYDNSGAFVRGEPMMQQGFSDLGFTDEQIDAFFVAAAQL